MYCRRAVAPLLPGREMEDFAQIARLWAAVGVGWHDFGHRPPPPLADFCLRDRRPQLLALDFGIREEIAGRRIEEDAVAQHAVLAEHRLEIGPDRVVAAGVLRMLVGIDRHAETFADHELPLVPPFLRSSVCETVTSITAVYRSGQAVARF